MAAVRVIAADGVDGATTRRIAQEANAPLATLHYCFATKEVLFAAVFEHVAGQYREVLTRNDVHGDVATSARALLRGVMEWYLANPDFGAAIVELISWGQRQEDQPGGDRPGHFQDAAAPTRRPDRARETSTLTTTSRARSPDNQ